MRLGDCCKTNLHTYSDKEKWSLIRYLDTGSITEGRIDEIQTLYPGVDKIPSRARRKASVGDILFSTVRPNQKHYGIIEAGTENLLVSTGFTVVTVDTTVADPYFIYYYLTQSSVIESLQAIAEQSTSTYPSIKPSDIEDIELDLPELETQRKIGSTLRMLDRKIALNEEINDNLEAVLAASHSKMFFSKDTSEHSKLGELMTFGNGKSRPKTDGPIPVYGGNGVLSYTDHHNIENAVLIGRVGAYCGSVYLEQGICWVSDNAIFAKSKITKDEFFDYFLLKRLNLFNHHVGTGQQLLTQEILNNIEVPKPVTEQIELFNRKATSIFETIFTNSREIIRLQELSDLLLSRLAG